MNFASSLYFSAVVATLAIASVTYGQEPGPTRGVVNPDGAKAATAAMAAFRVPDEFTVELFAAEPKLMNPIAIFRRNLNWLCRQLGIQTTKRIPPIAYPVRRRLALVV